jgi:hypothetical protein
MGTWLGRPPRNTGDPLTWKDYHFMCGGRLGMRLRGVLYGVTVLAALSIAVFRRDLDYDDLLAVYSFVPFAFSLDVGGMAGRIFRVEMRDQTLSTLAVLPCSMREVAVRKVRAFLIAAVPGASAVICVGIILIAAQYANGESDSIGDSLRVMSVWSNIPVLAFLTALFSLDLKYGALPLAYLVTAYMTSTLAGGGGSSSGAIFLGACVISLLCAFYFHREISLRLEAIAGRD